MLTKNGLKWCGMNYCGKPFVRACDYHNAEWQEMEERKSVKIYGDNKPVIAMYRETKKKQERLPTTQFEKEVRMISSKVIRGEHHIKTTDVLKLFRKHLKRNGGMF